MIKDLLIYNDKNKFINLFKSNIFILILFLAFPLTSFLTHFDISNKTVFTLNNVYYDFSSSWRLHVSRLIDDQEIYKDFFYPYPPLGLQIISIVFEIIGNDIFKQSLFTAFIAISIHLVLFLILEQINKSKFLLIVGLLISYSCLNLSYRHEIFLGGNPFPLIFGFLFFALGILFFLREKSYYIIFFLVACSFKHEFWIPTIFSIILAVKTYQIKDFILVISIILINVSFNYTDFEIITGMGRSSWARWQFNWESGIIHVLLTLPMILVFKYKYAAYSLLLILFLLCINNEFLFIDYSIIFNSRVGKFLYTIHNTINIGSLCNYTVLFGLLFILLNESNKKILLLLSLITLLQARRLFEWSEITYNCLIPIGFIYAYIKTDKTRLKSVYEICLVKLSFISVFSYLIHTNNVLNFLNNSNNTEIINTNIGKIQTINSSSNFNSIFKLINEKDITCFPFHSGMSLLMGSNLVSPVNYYYDRNRIKTFDFYKDYIQLHKPEYYILDKNFDTWYSYPELQFSFFDWKLKKKKVNLINTYPEIKDIINERYSLDSVFDNFVLYKRNY